MTQSSAPKSCGVELAGARFRAQGFNRRQFVATALAASVGAPRVWAQESSNTIVLGQSCALSGFAAEIGLQFHQGAAVFFEELNAQGGVGGRKVQLKVLDDGYEPERCVLNTRRFLQDDVAALFGYVGTPTSVAALPVIQQARIPFFAPLTGAQVLRQAQLQHLVFNVRASYSDETALMVRQLTGIGLKKIAVFYQNDGYGLSGLEGVTTALALHGLQPHITATVERNSSQVKEAVQKIVKSGPDVIVQVCTYAASADFVREARAAGFGGQFYNVSFVGTQALQNALGKDAEGVVVTQVVPSPFKTSHPAARDFIAALRKFGKENAQPNYSSMEGYLVARVFAEGLRRAVTAGGRVTREAIATALDGLSGQQVAGFPVTFQSQATKGRFVELSMLTGDGRVKV